MVSVFVGFLFLPLIEVEYAKHSAQNKVMDSGNSPATQRRVAALNTRITRRDWTEIDYLLAPVQVNQGLFVYL